MFTLAAAGTCSVHLGDTARKAGEEFAYRLRISEAQPDFALRAVPGEDRMQAFLWRHLVPASELKALVFDPSAQRTPKRVPRARPSSAPETN